MAEVELDCVEPPRNLTRYVTLFYRIVADLPLVERPVPVAGAHLRIHFGPASIGYGFATDADGGGETLASKLHLVAPTADAPRLTARAPVRLFGMELTPLGWAALVGDRSFPPLIDAVPILGDGVARSVETLDPEADAATLAESVAPQLATLLAVDDPAIAAFVRAVDAWLADGTPYDVARLVAATGLSRRQVERRCNWLYGSPPALLARQRRALRAARQLADGTPSRDVLTASDFYDQSHFIREVKRFTGMTPGQLGAGALLLPSVIP